MKSPYLVAVVLAIALAACSQQQQTPVQHAVTTAAPAPMEPPVPPTATDAKTDMSK